MTVKTIGQNIVDTMEFVGSTDLTNDEDVLFNVMACVKAAAQYAGGDPELCSYDTIRRMQNMGLVIRRKFPIPENVTEDGEVNWDYYDARPADSERGAM